MRIFEIFPLAGFFIIELMIAGRFIYLKDLGIITPSKSKQSVIISFLLNALYFVVLLIFVSELCAPAFHANFSFLPANLTTPLYTSVFLQTSGIVLTTISALLLFKTLYDFKTSFRLRTNSENLGKLITSGIFSVTRNPFFISVELYFIGTALTLPSLFFIAMALFVIISIHFLILAEETFLQKNYGDTYKKYSQKVRRYF